MLHEPRDLLETKAQLRPERPVRGTWLRLVRQVLQLGDGQAQLLRHAERPWASVTFSGARHTIELAFEGAAGVDAGERLVAALPDHEFAVPGHLVADATITEAVHEQVPQPRLVLTVELLLLEDA